MSSRDWDAEAEAAWSRDPRQAPYAVRIGSRFGDGPNLFSWFESLEELVDHLLEVEPRFSGILPGDGLEEYQARVRPILERVREEGLTEHLLRCFDPAEDGGFIVHWWGRYEDLRDGRDGFGCDVRDAFVRRWGGDERAPREREDQFVEFLCNYGV